MNCSSVRRKLSAYRDGALSKDARWHIRRHLKECATCRAELERLETFLSDLGRIEAPPAPDHLWDRIRDSAGAPRIAEPARPWGPRQGLSAAAGFLVMAAAIASSRTTERPVDSLPAPSREERVIDEVDYDVWYLDGRRVVRDRTLLQDSTGRDPLGETLLDLKEKKQ